MTQILLRQATPADAANIAHILRASRMSHSWLPHLHSPEQDLAFVTCNVLPKQIVTVAEVDDVVVGFVSVNGEWIEHLYVRPSLTSRGIGTHLLTEALERLSVARLYCFQENAGARRFYERHGFRTEATSDGSNNEEGLPDILYVRESLAETGGA